MFCKDSIPQDVAVPRAYWYQELFKGCTSWPKQALSSCPRELLQPGSPVLTLLHVHRLQTSWVILHWARQQQSLSKKQTSRGQPFTVPGIQSPISMSRVLSLWNSQEDTYIINILSHLPHEGIARHSSPFDDTNSYFDFTHIFALKTISCDNNNESSDFSHSKWTQRFLFNYLKWITGI